MDNLVLSSIYYPFDRLRAFGRRGLLSDPVSKPSGK
jgi:hypothetical protein